MRKSLNAFYYVAVICIASILLNCSSSSLSQSYRGFGYTMAYPYDWEAQNQQGFIALFHHKNPDKGQWTTVNIQVLATKKEQGKYDNAEDAYTDFKKQITDATKNGAFSQETLYEMKNIKGTLLKGKQFVATYEYEGIPFKQWQIVLPDTDGRYVLAWSYTATTATYDASLALAKEMLKSWQISL